MKKEDLEKLQRIALSVREMQHGLLKIGIGKHAPFVKLYSSYYDLVKPVVLRYSSTQYYLEFGAVVKPSDVSPYSVLPASISLKSFLDSIINDQLLSKEKSISSEFFIDGNKPFTANKIISDVIVRANVVLKVIDNYMDQSTLNYFYQINSRVEIQILMKELKPTKDSCIGVIKKFVKEWGGEKFFVKKTKHYHDRFLLVDDSEVWFCGPSLNYAGSKAMCLVEIKEQQVKDLIIKSFNEQWEKAEIVFP